MTNTGKKKLNKFLELIDTPDSFVGQSAKVVKVKTDETGLEFGVDGGGSGSSYTHIQGSASLTWNVVHNLGAKPVVQLVNGTDDVIYGSVVHVSVNELNCVFNTAITGKAFLTI